MKSFSPVAARRTPLACVVALALAVPSIGGCGAFPFFRGAGDAPAAPADWGSRMEALGAAPEAYSELALLIRQTEAHPGNREMRRVRASTLLELSLGLAWARRLDPAAAAQREEALAAALAQVAPGEPPVDSLGDLVRGDLLAIGEPAPAADAAADYAMALLRADSAAAARLAQSDVLLVPYQALTVLLCADALVSDLAAAENLEAQLAACGVPRAPEIASAAPDPQAVNATQDTEQAGDDDEGSGSDALAATEARDMSLLVGPTPELAGYVWLAARVAQAPASGVPEEALHPLVAEHLVSRSVLRAPLRIAPAYWSADVRLDIPIARMPADGLDSLAATLAWRVLLVRSDGFSVLPAPLARIEGLPDGAHSTLDEVAFGWSPASTPQVRFDGAGALSQSSIVDDRVPELATRLIELDGWLAEADGVPPVARDGAGEGATISVVSDGGVYVSTLMTLLQTSRDTGFSSVHIHTRDRDGRLRTFPLHVADDPLSPAHLLVVRGDGYSLTPYDPTALTNPTNFLRTSRSCLLELTQFVTESLASGVMDATIPIRIRVDDGSLDVGLLAHLLAAITWQRSLDGVESDVQLAQAPALVVDGAPVRLHPAGIELLP